MFRPGFLAIAVSCALSGAAIAQTTPTPSPYSANYVFGDSLSDQGNLAEYLRHNFPSPPSYHDSFTNGPVAVQVLSQRLGLTLTPSLFATGFVDKYNLGLTGDGTNYAVAGSTAGNAMGVQGGNLPTQVGAFLARSGGTASSSALYTVFIGGNDVRTAAHQGDTGYVTGGIASELANIRSLYAAGARNFLVVNVPDIGRIPEFQLGYPTQVSLASSDTVLFNQMLSNELTDFKASNPLAKVTPFDLAAFQSQLLQNPGAYGITDTTTPCYTSYTGITTPDTGYAVSAACGAIDPVTGQPANIDKLAFWDAIHPTAVVQRAIGNALADAVLATPEPATWLTMVLGFGLIGTALRRRRGGARPALA